MPLTRRKADVIFASRGTWWSGLRAPFGKPHVADRNYAVGDFAARRTDDFSTSGSCEESVDDAVLVAPCVVLADSALPRHGFFVL